MDNHTKFLIKDAVYTALAGGAFYYAAKVLKADTGAALIIGTGIGHILALNSNLNNNVDKIFD